MNAAPAPRAPVPVAAQLAACGVPLERPASPAGDAVHADLEWARSGAMALTGEAQRPPRLAPAPLASRARQLVAAARSLSGAEALAALDGPALLGERAACFGLGRQGRRSPGGSCRLLEAADGWLAVNLARESDGELVPAWLEAAAGEVAGRGVWPAVEVALPRRPVAEWVERATLLGLPVAGAGPPPTQVPPWARIEPIGMALDGPGAGRPRVVDLSPLWAGPLCAQLLLLAGARVVKVESASRPDGARRGAPRFHDLLNAGKASVALDLEGRDGRTQLRRILERADVVIESARPRALRQLGVDAETWVGSAPGRVWVSLTGYGRPEPWGSRVAFGDDAAAAGGLADATGAPGPPLFCGDAIADPLAGLHAAVATLAARRAGGGVLIDVPLRDGVAHLCAGARDVGEARVEPCAGGFAVSVAGQQAAVAPPRARRPRGRARPLGADTHAVLSETC